MNFDTKNKFSGGTFEFRAKGKAVERVVSIQKPIFLYFEYSQVERERMKTWL